MLGAPFFRHSIQTGTNIFHTLLQTLIKMFNQLRTLILANIVSFVHHHQTITNITTRTIYSTILRTIKQFLVVFVQGVPAGQRIAVRTLALVSSAF